VTVVDELLPPEPPAPAAASGPPESPENVLPPQAQPAPTKTRKKEIRIGSKLAGGAEGPRRVTRQVDIEKRITFAASLFALAEQSEHSTNLLLSDRRKA
jgi:hypothetical protein